MRRHDFGFDRGPLERWLDDLVLASRRLVDHTVDRVDRLVGDVLRDADEVARRAVDLFDGFVASLHERDGRGPASCGRHGRGSPDESGRDGGGAAAV
jgi:hypothetical protein